MASSARIFKVNRDENYNNVVISNTLKVPRYYSDFPKGLGITGESGFEGNIIYNLSDGQYYGHDGVRWFPLGGSGGGNVTLTSTGGTSLVVNGLGPDLSIRGLTSNNGSITITQTPTTIDLAIGSTNIDYLLVYVNGNGNDDNTIIQDATFTTSTVAAAPISWPQNVIDILNQAGFPGSPSNPSAGPVWQNVLDYNNNPLINPVATLERAFELVRENGWNERAYIIVGDSAGPVSSAQSQEAYLNMTTGNTGYQRNSLGIIGFLRQKGSSIQLVNGFPNGRELPGLIPPNPPVPGVSGDVDFATSFTLGMLDSPPTSGTVSPDGNTITSVAPEILWIDNIPMRQTNTFGSTSYPSINFPAGPGPTRILIKDGVNIVTVSGSYVDYRLNGVYVLVDPGSDGVGTNPPPTQWILQRANASQLQRAHGFEVGDAQVANESYYVYTPYSQIQTMTALGSDNYQITTTTPHYLDQAYQNGIQLNIFTPGLFYTVQPRLVSIDSPTQLTVNINMLVYSGPGVNVGLVQLESMAIPNASGEFNGPQNNTNLYIVRDNIIVADAFDEATNPAQVFENIVFRFKGNVDQLIQVTSSATFPATISLGDVLVFPNLLSNVLSNINTRMFVSEIINSTNIVLCTSSILFANTAQVTTAAGVIWQTVDLYQRTSNIVFDGPVRLFGGSDHSIYVTDINWEFIDTSALSFENIVDTVIIDQINLYMANVGLINAIEYPPNSPPIAIQKSLQLLNKSSIMFGGSFFGGFIFNLTGDYYDLAGIYFGRGPYTESLFQYIYWGDLVEVYASLFDQGVQFNVIQAQLGQVTDSYFNESQGLNVSGHGTLAINTCRFQNPQPGSLVLSPSTDNGTTALLSVSGQSELDISACSIRCSDPWISLNNNYVIAIQATDASIVNLAQSGTQYTCVIYDLSTTNGDGDPGLGLIISASTASLVSMNIYAQNMLAGVYGCNIDSSNLINNSGSEMLQVYDINGPYINNGGAAFLYITDCRGSINLVTDIGTGTATGLANMTSSQSGALFSITTFNGNLSAILMGPWNIASSPTEALTFPAVNISNSRFYTSSVEQFSVDRQITPTNGIVIGGFSGNVNALVNISNSDIDATNNKFMQAILPVASVIMYPNINGGTGTAIELNSNTHLTNANDSTVDIEASGGPHPGPLQVGAVGPFSLSSGSHNDYTSGMSENCSFN